MQADYVTTRVQKNSLNRLMAHQKKGVGRRRCGWKLVKIDLKKYNLSENLAKDILKWINNIHIVNYNIAETRL